MKRCSVIILLMLMLMLPSTDSFAEFTLKIGADFAGDHDVSGRISGYNLSGSADVDESLSLSGEYIKRVNWLEYGAGVTLLIPRSQEDYDGDFYFVPAYGLIKLRSPSEEVAPYITGHIGYNFFKGDSKYEGGITLDEDIYYAGGIGIIIKNSFQIEALYTSNNGKAKVAGHEFDIEYTKVTISVGFTF